MWKGTQQQWAEVGTAFQGVVKELLEGGFQDPKLRTASFWAELMEDWPTFHSGPSSFINAAYESYACDITASFTTSLDSSSNLEKSTEKQLENSSINLSMVQIAVSLSHAVYEDGEERTLPPDCEVVAKNTKGVTLGARWWIGVVGTGAGKGIYLTFRGTHDLYDMLVDAQVTPGETDYTSGLGVSIHSGFAASLSLSLPAVMKALRGLSDVEGFPLIVCGHSLGASYAQLFQIAQKEFVVDAVIGFGPPPTFWFPSKRHPPSAEMLAISRRTHLFVHRLDVIPRLSGDTVHDLRTMLNTFGFSGPPPESVHFTHIGQVYFLVHEYKKEVYRTIHVPNISKKDREVVENVLDMFPPLFTFHCMLDHKMMHYEKAVQSLQ